MKTKTENEILEEIDKYKAELAEYKDQLPKTNGKLGSGEGILDSEVGKTLLDKKIRTAENYIKTAERELTYIDNGPVTRAAVKALLAYISELIEALNPTNASYSISRNQGTIKANFLYGKIMTDLKKVYELGHNMFHSPGSDYYQDRHQNVKYKLLQQVLQQGHEELITTRSFNYISLREFVEKLNSQLRALEQEDKG